MAPSRTSSKPIAHCVGSPSWTPSSYLSNAETHNRVSSHLASNELEAAVTAAFCLPKHDTYVYHAIVAVTLAQAQHIVSLGSANGLHAWYRSESQAEEPAPLPPPPKQDIEAYLSIFAPGTSTPNTLKGFAANAKKGSLRTSIAAHLLSKRFLHPSLPALQIPRCKKPPPNPYLDFLSWSCLNLEWAGPCEASEKVKNSHHILPILMHHFGCVCPSHEALSVLKIVTAERDILDMGSGNGYWTFMLRQYGLTVHPVDNEQSEWRATWVDDTEIKEGVSYLKKHDGGKDAVLLMVYPVVGGGLAGGEEGGFTRSLLKAYRGDTVAVVGTQNHNGYTGFRGMSMDEYMATEQPEWTKIVQIPLPSFAGKDEALFVFQRDDRAPKDVEDKKNGDKSI